MSERPKTHQERAERVLDIISTVPPYRDNTEKTEIIAGGTYPTELVAAARAVLEEAERAGWSEPLCNLETVLTLYPEAP